MTMILLADRTGAVRMGTMALANAARITPAECNKGLLKLQAPDPESRTQEFEGRRIEHIPGGFRLLNFAKYQPSKSKPPTEARKAKMREYINAKRKAGKTPEPKPELELIAEEPIPSNDRTPTTAEALFVAQLFNRRPKTKWSENEIRAFKKAFQRGVFDAENQKLLADYYARERARGDAGIHRRDLVTFLNNIDGELDRARAGASGTVGTTSQRNGQNPNHPRTVAASAANSGTSNASQAGKY